MATAETTQETRLIFYLERNDGNERTTRTITIPGAVPNEQTQTAVLTAWQNFRNSILTGAIGGGTYANYLTTFIQPTAWRDDTGSTITDTDQEPWTAYDVGIESYVVEKQRWTGEDITP